MPILSLGGKGVISVLSNVAAEETHDICEFFFTEKIKASTELQLKAIPLVEQLFCESESDSGKEGDEGLDGRIVCAASDAAYGTDTGT